MLGFPAPYPNELLYSVIARAGVHEGETSPKQLLDLVFANRKVIATVDLPCHVESIASQYPKSLGLTSKVLIRNHTLWPIYSSFVPLDRRAAIERWMRGESKGAAHLAVGMVASRVRSKQKLLLCASCRDEHKLKYGEAFWDRRWQVPLVSYCPSHGSLSETDISLNGEHRHEFIPISQCKAVGRVPVTKSDIRFAELAYGLFDCFKNEFPSYQQWTRFYRNLAIDHGFLVGNRIDHRRLHEQYVSYWGNEWLNRAGLLPKDKDTSWLKSIFRKHRKTFCFAEHLTVIEAISQGNTQTGKAIEQALCYQTRIKEPEVYAYVELGELSEDQNDWLILLNSNGPKAARNKKPALYARLYRNNYEWLMHVNHEFYQPIVSVNTRVDWSKRDRLASRALLDFIGQAEEDLFIPRLSRTFLIHQLTNRATIEKNLYRLPRCRAILERYSESIDEYQARRLTRAFIALSKGKQALKEWVLLRKAGLSEERMSCFVKGFLKEIFKGGE